MSDMMWPEKRGLYVCEKDGKEIVLHHHYCQNNGRHWWSDTSGYDVLNVEKVLRPYIVQKGTSDGC